MSQLNIPPVSTLAGSTFGNYLSVLRQGRIHPKAYFKVGLTGLICLVSSPFHWYEKIIDNFNRGGDLKSPIFILGHWRSGTTHLHNLLCQDQSAGFIDTYHSLFPNNLHSKLVFRTFMKLGMPDRRPGDHMRLNVDLPQEDEFAIGNISDNSYYHFFYFPEQYRKIYCSAVTFRDVSQLQIENWKRTYQQLLKKALINTNGDHLIVKNPVNSARIGLLLNMFPDAKFVHIHRNPIIVYLSTLKFFKFVIPALNFQNFDDENITEIVLATYKSLMTDLFAQQHLVPKENWIDIRFEKFHGAELNELEKIYNQFGLKFEQSSKSFGEYLDHIGDHKISEYKIKKGELDLVKSKFEFAMQRLGYAVPDNLVIESDR